MNARLPIALVHALAAMEPPDSVVHQCIGENEAAALCADRAYNASKSVPQPDQRAIDAALRRDNRLRRLGIIQ